MRTTFFTVGPEDAGERLDRVVAAHCPELSRTRAQELIEGGLVLIEGRAAKGASRVRDGQRISVDATFRGDRIERAGCGSHL